MNSSDARDLALMHRVSVGDTAAFVELVEVWQPRLAQFLLFKGARRGELDDLLQDVFLRVYNYRDRFRARGAGSVRAFLCCVAQRTYIDAWRRHERQNGANVSKKAGRLPRATESRAQGSSAYAELESIPCTVSLDVALRDEKLDLEDAVLRLPSRLRDVVSLVTWQGLSYPEVARVLGIPVGTVKSRMHYALRRLSEALDVEARS